MPVTINIPAPLRPYAGDRKVMNAEPGTVDSILKELVAAHPKLKAHLYKEAGKLQNFVNIYVNDTDVRELAGGETPVSGDDTVSIVPSIAGGRPSQLSVATPELEPAEILRYSRHLILPDVGLDGQRRLKGARILLVGAGGLGSPAALYLAAAGVGTIGLVDFDKVDETNLQRQIIHGTNSVGHSKLDSAEARIRDLNPHTKVEKFETRLTSQNAFEILREFDVVVDGTDNFPTRYLVNDACVLLDKPNVYGSIFRFEGQASVFDARLGPCYRCVYSEPPPPGLVPSCAEGGVLGVLPGIIGTMQALETIKLIIGRGRSLVGRLILFDAMDFTFRELKLKKDPGCPICGEHPTITELIDYEAFCGIDTESGHDGPEITALDLSTEWREKPDLVVIDVRDHHEWQICHIEGTILVPLGELPQRLNEFDGHADIVTHCHSGARSMRALEILNAAGFASVRSLKGGIDAWSTDVDPGVPRY